MGRAMNIFIILTAILVMFHFGGLGAGFIVNYLSNDLTTWGTTGQLIAIVLGSLTVAGLTGLGLTGFAVGLFGGNLGLLLEYLSKAAVWTTLSAYILDFAIVWTQLAQLNNMLATAICLPLIFGCLLVLYEWIFGRD